MSTLIGLKLNMSQLFQQDGTVIPMTYIDVKGVKIIGTRTEEKDGYNAAILGFGIKKNPIKPETEKYKSIGYVPQYSIETRLEKLEGIVIGEEIKPSVLELNSKISVTGFTKGKGFQGVVKRWGFAGGPRTHGQSDRERHGGSLGMRTTPGRVFKGKKMPGRMGFDKKTVKGLKVVFIDDEKGIIGLKGAVPGNKGSLVILRSRIIK